MCSHVPGSVDGWVRYALQLRGKPQALPVVRDAAGLKIKRIADTRPAACTAISASKYRVCPL